MKLMENSKKLIEEHLKKDLDPISMEVMQYVVMALVLTVEEVAAKRLPQILEELEIYAEDKSVIEMAHEYLNNYSEDELLKLSDATVTRTLKFNEDDNSFAGEDRTILISLKKNNDYFSIISRLIHEFFHLLRYGGVKQNGNKHKIKNGIELCYYDFEKESVKRKYQNFEEGIVQKYTYIAIHNLYDLIKNENIDSDVYKNFIEGYKGCTFSEYMLQRKIIDDLCQDQRFYELLEDSFTDEENPPELIKYFNSVMNSSTAFTQIGKLLDEIINAIILDNLDEDSLMKKYMELNVIVSNFINKSKNYNNGNKRLVNN